MFGHVNVPDWPTTTADPPSWQVTAAPPLPNEVVEAMTHELVVPGAYMATQDGWTVGTRVLLASSYHDVAGQVRSERAYSQRPDFAMRYSDCVREANDA